MPTHTAADKPAVNATFDRAQRAAFDSTLHAAEFSADVSAKLPAVITAQQYAQLSAFQAAIDAAQFSADHAPKCTTFHSTERETVFAAIFATKHAALGTTYVCTVVAAIVKAQRTALCAAFCATHFAAFRAAFGPTIRRAHWCPDSCPDYSANEPTLGSTIQLSLDTAVYSTNKFANHSTIISAIGVSNRTTFIYTILPTFVATFGTANCSAVQCAHLSTISAADKPAFYTAVVAA